jgi:hypothetical protein
MSPRTYSAFRTLASRLALPCALLGALALAGCSGESSQPTPGSGTPIFVMADPGAGPVVYLRAGHVAPGSLTLEVVGRGVPNVYGLAFRIESTAGVLVPAALTPSPSWSANALAVEREPVPGLLVVGLSERGSAAGFAADADVLLATLDFQLGAAVVTPVTFVDGEGAVAQASGGELAGVSWVGGAISLAIPL